MALNLKKELTRLLAKAWNNISPDVLSDGAPQETPLPEDTARRIVEHYEAENEQAELENHDGSLPILARLRPRGYWEDDWRARPTKDRPWPVILVHGTGASAGYFQELGAELRHDGWATFAVSYGHRATDPLASSAAQVGAYIDAVLAATGADQAVVIGHSQGGVLPRWWMRHGGGAGKIRHLVTLGAPHHGTTHGGIVAQALTGEVGRRMADSIIDSWFGPAGFEQIHGSDFLAAINDDGDTEAGMSYTCIATHYDAVVQPPETAFLHTDRESARVRNVWVQDLDPTSVVSHDNLPRDRRVRQLVRADLTALVENL